MKSIIPFTSVDSSHMNEIVVIEIDQLFVDVIYRHKTNGIDINRDLWDDTQFHCTQTNLQQKFDIEMIPKLVKLVEFSLLVFHVCYTYCSWKVC